jgi:hypothetical protein
MFWLSARDRRKVLIPPYAEGQTVYSQESQKSFISLVDNNVDNPDESNTSWKEINYKKPLYEDNIPNGITNPLEELLALFTVSFDLSTLAPIA